MSLVLSTAVYQKRPMDRKPLSAWTEAAEQVAQMRKEKNEDQNNECDWYFLRASVDNNGQCFAELLYGA